MALYVVVNSEVVGLGPVIFFYVLQLFLDASKKSKGKKFTPFIILSQKIWGLKK
jgi:hypothetical protein